MDEEFQLSVSFNDDSRGFLSRECESCARRFKVIHDETKPTAHCPFCEHDGDDWWTKEQGEYVVAVGAEAVGSALQKRLEGSELSSIGLTITADVDVPKAPSAPFEPEDETFVETVSRAAPKSFGTTPSTRRSGATSAERLPRSHPGRYYPASQ